MKKQMSMKVLMRNAWKIAKKAAVKFGGSAVEYISGAMKRAWAMKREFEGTAKDWANKEIKSWFMNKNYIEQESYMIETSHRSVIKETEKAVNFKCFGKMGVKYIWVPKSCLI